MTSLFSVRPATSQLEIECTELEPNRDGISLLPVPQDLPNMENAELASANGRTLIRRLY